MDAGRPVIKGPTRGARYWRGATDAPGDPAGVIAVECRAAAHRVGILAHALAPLKSQVPKAAHDRLHQALSVVYGIEPYVILKDIWGLPDPKVDSIALWMANALVDATLAEAGIEKNAKVTSAKVRRVGRSQKR